MCIYIYIYMYTYLMYNTIYYYSAGGGLGARAGQTGDARLLHSLYIYYISMIAISTLLCYTYIIFTTHYHY